MKTIISKKTKATFAVLVLLALATSAFAYPPDNAAVLYYKAFMLYEKPDNTGPMWDYWKGNIESNEEIEAFLKKNRRIINIVLDAASVDHCDWGMDYSQGTEILLPPLHKAREIFVLLAVDARMQADRGNYRKALRRSMSIYRMTRHFNERPIVCYLVGTAINSATNKYLITQFLSEMPQDLETLTWLRDELAELDKRPFSIGPVLRWKREAGIISMSAEKIDDAVRSGLDDGPFKEKVLKKILEADEQFFDRNRKYWNNYMGDIKTAFDLPYPQAYSKLKQLDEKPSKEYSKNPDATLTAAFSPTWSRIYNISMRLGSHSNAVKAAIEIYIIKAKTGKLPDALPTDLPLDLFSGKAFQYEKTKDGFVLRCRGKDLARDINHQYEFKIKK